jgi:flagellar L-ring protein FlgH
MLLRIAWTMTALALCATAAADSLFTANSSNAGTLVSEKKSRFSVGDIITVMVKEEITASAVSDINTKKESDVQSQADEKSNDFLVNDKGMNIIPKEDLPNWDIQAKNETKTTGKTRRTSTIETTITCFVTQVLPNGNIMIEGEKSMTVNREESTLVIEGIARPTDVTQKNTILSTQIANAQVHLKGKGPLWNNQRRGMITRVLDWFSPF